MSRQRFLMTLFAVLLVLAIGFIIGGMKDDNEVRYLLTGNIVVLNDCDGEQVSIPARVRVHAWLSSDRAPNRSGGAQNVDLAPDPAEPNAPKKIGTYRISVPWTGVPGDPSKWSRPTVEINGKEICGTITCTPGVCADRATAADIPFNDPVTNHDIHVQCACGN